MKAVVIGASAGAVEALSAILPRLPASFPLPILIVVHLPAQRPSVLAELLADKCQIRVTEAEDKEPIAPGAAYLAPPDYHLLVEHDGSLSLSADPPVRFSRPSIDVLFESAADAYGPGLVGIVLTGANSDGADGLRQVGQRGGVAIVQTPESAYAATMPSAALAAWPAARPLDLEQIATFLCQLDRGDA